MIGMLACLSLSDPMQSRARRGSVSSFFVSWARGVFASYSATEVSQKGVPEGFFREDSQQVPADSSTFQQVAASAAGSAGTSRFLKVPQVPAGSAGTSRTQQFPAMLSRIERVAARSSKSQQNAESAAHSSRSQQVPAIPAGRSRFQQVQIYCADSCIRFAEKPRPEG